MSDEITRASIEKAITKQINDKRHLDNEQMKDYIRSNCPSRISEREDFNDILTELIDSDERIRDNIIETFITQQDLITSPDNQYSVRQYLDACRFTGFTMMGIHPVEAWKFTFPERYNKLYRKWHDTGVADRTIKNNMHSRANAYRQGKLVTNIVQRCHVPLYVHNATIAESAIKTLDDLRVNSKSERIQMESSKVLLEYLQPPKELLIKQDVVHSVKDEDGVVSQLTSMLADISAVGQKRMKEDGLTVQAIDVKVESNE